MPRKKQPLCALLLATATFFATAPAWAGDIVWARYGDSDSLDPHRTTTTLSMQSWRQIYDTLLAFDDNGQPRPGMAKSYTVSDDGLKVTFKLHDGIKCHDGTPFDSKDVKYTFDRALDDKNPSLTKSAWGPITGVETPDPLTVVVTFSKPFGAFIPFMADPFSSMLCDSDEALGDAFGVSKAIGTGPWKLVEWVKGDKIVLEKNPDYRNFGQPVENKGPPYEDRLIIKEIPEAQTRLAGLKTGELDIAEPPLEEVESVKKDPNLKLYVAEKTGQNVFFEFAISRPPFNDVRARLAVAHALDVDTALDIAFEGLVQREKCPVALGVFGADEDLCAKYLPDYDPDKSSDAPQGAGLRAGQAARGHDDDLDRRRPREAGAGFPEPAAAGRHQGQDRGHGHRHAQCAREAGEQQQDRPGHVRSHGLVLVRPGYSLSALALARRL